MKDWNSDEEFWTADCRCGNYTQDKLIALAKERDAALAALEEIIKIKHAYQTEVERLQKEAADAQEA